MLKLKLKLNRNLHASPPSLRRRRGRRHDDLVPAMDFLIVMLFHFSSHPQQMPRLAARICHGCA
jgi:hypothetical protein